MSVSYHESLEVEGIATCTHITKKGNGNLKIGNKVLKIDIYCREETNLQSKGSKKGSRIL